MSTLINLEDLLRHEVMDLYSCEEQIIDALPKMIENANNAELKKALSEHLKVTKSQKSRLDEVKKLMGTKEAQEEDKGFFSKLFSGSEKCKGTEGLIKEGEKMMGEDMSPEVMDAAIIASCQKLEHYEISGYGTARAFARELNLDKVVTLLEQTLNEEYNADDLLTSLAVGRLNVKAEQATGENGETNMSVRKGSNGSKSASSNSNGKKTVKSTATISRSAAINSNGKSGGSKAVKSSSTTKSSGSKAKKSVPARSSAASKSAVSKKATASSKSKPSPSRKSSGASKTTSGGSKGGGKGGNAKSGTKGLRVVVGKSAGSTKSSASRGGGSSRSTASKKGATKKSAKSKSRR